GRIHAATATTQHIAVRRERRTVDEGVRIRTSLGESRRPPYVPPGARGKGRAGTGACAPDTPRTDDPEAIVPRVRDTPPPKPHTWTCPTGGADDAIPRSVRERHGLDRRGRPDRLVRGAGLPVPRPRCDPGPLRRRGTRRRAVRGVLEDPPA